MSLTFNNTCCLHLVVITDKILCANNAQTTSAVERLLICHLQHIDALYALLMFSYIYIYIYIYILYISPQAQLNGDLKGIPFVMLAVHEEVALMSFSQSETHLLLYVWHTRRLFPCLTKPINKKETHSKMLFFLQV